MNTAEKATEILKSYAEQMQVPIRSTSDISPLEDWLLSELIKSNDTIEQLKKFSSDREQ